MWTIETLWWIGGAISAAFWAGVLAHYLNQRRWGRRVSSKPVELVLTVWDENGKVIYDHPLRGRTARAMQRTMHDLMGPDHFVSDVIFPNPNNEETIEFVINPRRHES